MPIENVPISNITVGVGVIASIVILGVPAYIALTIKNFLLRMENIKVEVAKIEALRVEEKKETKEAFNEMFNRVRDLENVQNVLKTEHDYFCGKKGKGNNE